MISLIIVYVSEVLRSINLISFGVLILSIFIFMYYYLQVGNTELIDNYKGNLTKIFLISLILTIFVPSNLDDRILDAYLTENCKLKNKVCAMQIVIDRHKLEHEVELIERK